ncbi:hypothetical protein FRC06_007755 [Ceratobasidium sp. 370]|nr:hypothetical protein FRC06_007755 [Ceratobasidium sp. 370]
MSSAVDKTLTPRVVALLSQPARCSELINAMACTKKMVVFCGDSEGVPDALRTLRHRDKSLDEPVSTEPGSEARRSLRSLIKECSTTRVRPEDLPSASLAVLNRVMTECRIAARTTVPNLCMDFLVWMFEESRLATCLTSGFDGVETNGRPDLAERVGVAGDDVIEMDDTMISKGIVICQSCNRKNMRNAKARRMGNDATRTLRPAVQDYLGVDLAMGEGRANILQAAAGCQLFLILGASLKEADVLELTRDIASAVHENYGAVVYVDPEPLQGRHTYGHIDLHLQSEVQQTITRVLEEMNTFHAHVGSIKRDMAEDGEADLWYDLVNNELPRRQVAEEPPYLGPCCIHCSCGIPDYLVRCLKCLSYLCHRRTQSGGEMADLGEDPRTARPTPAPNDPAPAATAEEMDTFPNEEACIVFNLYATGAQRPALKKAKQDFVCSYCWDHKSQGLYPHGVRPVPRITAERPDAPRPRLAMLVFYANQFWPQTRHLCMMVAGLWRGMGWQCIIEPVKLEHLAENPGVFKDL